MCNILWFYLHPLSTVCMLHGANLWYCSKHEYKYIDTYVINNCISSLHSGLAIKEFCMARDGGKLENFDYSDCLTFIDLLCVS